jgi:hypothetical protein
VLAKWARFTQAAKQPVDAGGNVAESTAIFLNSIAIVPRGTFLVLRLTGVYRKGMRRLFYVEQSHFVWEMALAECSTWNIWAWKSLESQLFYVEQLDGGRGLGCSLFHVEHF